MKRCTKCGVEKPLEAYYTDKRAKDGRWSACVECVHAQRHADPELFKARHRASYARRREKVLARKKVYAEENRERIRAYQAQYREQNRAGAAERTRRWKEENPGAYRQWCRDNPDKIATYNVARRARLKGAFVAHVVPDAIILRDEGRCGICGEPIMETPTIDHIIPLDADGTHEPDNVQLAHLACNSRKGAKVNFTLREAA